MSVANKASLAFAIFGGLLSFLSALSMYVTVIGDLVPLVGLGILLVLFANLFFIFNFKNGLYALLLALYFISTWVSWVTIGSDVYFNDVYCVAVMLVVPIIFIAVAVCFLTRKNLQKVSLFAYTACVFSTALLQFCWAKIALSGI